MEVLRSRSFKKLLACILSVVMVCTILFSIAPAKVMADSTYTYRVLSNNTVEIAKYNGNGGNVDIPDTIDGMTVTSIGDLAFQNCKSLVTVTIPDNVRTIGGWSFGGCSSLVSVSIPDSVTSIGQYAFGGCTSLQTFDIPNAVTTIECLAFAGCTALTSIDIPDTVTTIEHDTFQGCTSLTSITIPDSVVSIGDSAFTGCRALTNITIPDSVTSIGEYAFRSCNALTSIEIPEGVTTIEKSSFEFCSSLTNVTIPNSVTTIGNFAFGDCESLTEIVIPDGVTTIGDYAFHRCFQLTSITVPNSVTSIGTLAINDYQDAIIYCYSNSYALTYALDNDIGYYLLDTNTVGNGVIPPAIGNTVDRSAAEAFSTRCYELVLNRTPDSTGLNNWTNSLVNNQNTGAHMAYGFFFSPEYLNSNTSNEEFVTTLYNVFLDRQPDPSGLADWVGQLEAGASREQVFAGVANSREFFDLCNGYGITAGHYVQGLDNSQQQNVNAFVARLYSMCLGRNGDYDGQASWVRQLINHENSGAGVAYGFFFSQEFINRNLTNEEYVATLYRVFLGREPDQAGFYSWVEQLNVGTDRLSIFRGFAHSQEYTNICSNYGIERGTI